MFFDLTAPLDKTNGKRPIGYEDAGSLTEKCTHITGKTDDGHHQDVIHGTCTIRQVLSFAQNNFSAPAFGDLQKSAGRVDTMPDAERYREASGSNAHFKTAAGKRHCAPEQSDLCFINRHILIEPPVIITGKIFKNAA